jgi:hypothetical protein
MTAFLLPWERGKAGIVRISPDIAQGPLNAAITRAQGQGWVDIGGLPGRLE